MQIFKAKPKQWGNSLGVTIPKSVVDEENISADKDIKVMILRDQERDLKKIFGALKMKKPTDQIMREIDEGYD